MNYDSKAGCFFLTVEDDEGCETEHRIAAKMVVCGRCAGKGQHCNPNIDGHGITESEWAEWGYDEQETYLSGGYDVTCYDCHGKNVVATVDDDRLSDELAALVDDYYQREADYAAERAYEQRMGC
jgi:hypothetical protein